MPRENIPFTTTMPPLEKKRLAAFAEKVGRPMGWVIRDALAVYIAAAESDADTLARVRGNLQAPNLNKSNLGKTPKTRRRKTPKA